LAILRASASSSFFSPFVHAAVLEQHDLTGAQLRMPCAAVDPVAHQRHLRSKQLGQSRADRRERILGLPLALGGTPEVRGDHDRRTAREGVADRGHRGADARVVGDRPRVILRDVEVGANEDALAAHVYVGEPAELHD
jgi:hypothetical protein